MTNAELSLWEDTLYVLVVGPGVRACPQEEWEFYDIWHLALHQELQSRRSGVGTK